MPCKGYLSRHENVPDGVAEYIGRETWHRPEIVREDAVGSVTAREPYYRREEDIAAEKEVETDSIRVPMKNLQRRLIPKEKAAKRCLAMRLSEHEAHANAVKLQRVATPRPLTYDSFCPEITALKGTVESVIITNFEEESSTPSCYVSHF